MNQEMLRTIKLQFRQIVYSFLIILITCFTAGVTEIHSQTKSLNAQDLSTVRSADISDAQLRAYMVRGRSEGISPQQAMDMARARGLSPAVANELMQRMRALETAGMASNGTQTHLRSDNSEPVDLIDTIEFVEDDKPFIFGSTLFKRGLAGFEPSMNIPTPVNYVLGPGDELVIDIWGATTNLHQLTVSPEGTVTIDNLGPVYVHGLTIEEADKRVIEKLKQLYRGLRPGQADQTTFARVSLGRVRTIQVTVMGEVNVPGSYSVSSLATVFNALYKSGGPNRIGSYRNIEVIRGNKVVSRLDVYDLLLRGDQQQNIRLNDQDIIRVSPLVTRVEIRGEVKRPGLYEAGEKESLADLIGFAGHFTDSAYTRQVSVQRNTETERMIVSVNRDNFASFPMQNGDVVSVDPILNRFANRVTISGAVWRPGDYELTEGFTLSQLIQQAEGLKPDVFRERAVINRLDERHDFSVVAFNVDQVLSQPEYYDIVLQPEDEVIIRSIHDMREERMVYLGGEIRKAGSYQFRDGMTLEDLILIGEGFKSSASEARIEINRRIIGEAAPARRGTRLAETFVFSVERNLALREEARRFELQPNDQVFVRARPDYQVQQTITIQGEVMFPGTYAITDRNERISDIIRRAGGLTDEAFVPGATLMRTSQQLERVETVLETGLSEVVDLTKDKESFIGINLGTILSKPGTRDDLFVRPGDVIKVPAELQTVRVSGGVLRDSEIRYIKGKDLRYYIKGSGGYAQNARKSRAYVVYANGDVDTRSRYLFFGISPEITPGAEIIIPQRVERPPMTPGERISIFSSVVSMAAVVITAMSRF